MEDNKDQNNESDMPNIKKEIFPQEQKTGEIEVDDDLNAYYNLMATSSKARAKAFKYKIYEHILLEVEDLNFLKARLGIYTEDYLSRLKENLPVFSKIVLKEIEESNYPEVKRKAILNLKEKFENIINEIYFESVSKTSNVRKKNSEKNIDIDSNIIEHPPYDANLFNIKGYKLFKYLVENFVEISKRGDKTQFMSIWHYFNNDLNNNIEFKKHKGLTQETYKELAKFYGVEITNTDKTESYENKHLTILNSHFEAFTSNPSKK